MTEANEIWKPVVGYEEIYEVSDYGNVRTLKAGKMYPAGWLLAPQANQRGDLSVELGGHGSKRRTFFVDRLVAAAYIGQAPTQSHEIYHKDRNQSNNHISNLEYVHRVNNRCDLPGEEWRDISGWGGLYQVSNLGRARSLTRVDEAKRVRKGKLLTPHKTPAGYQKITLSGMGASRPHSLHALVASAFLGTRPAGHDINHIDGIKTNNAASNLEYCTRQENISHAERLHLTRHAHGQTVTKAKLTDANVREILKLAKTGLPTSELSRRYSVTGSTIRKIVRREAWRHIQDEV